MADAVNNAATDTVNAAAASSAVGSAVGPANATATNAATRTIEVSAVAVRNPEGRVLNVRKRGTHTLMLPGGKPEPGEDPRDTAIREFLEELGVKLDPMLLRGLGTYRSAAANEADHDVLAHVYEHPYVAVDHPLAEIEHLEWVDPTATYSPSEMAPLNIEHVFPALARPERPAQRITIYTGSSVGNSPAYLEAATAFGAALARKGIGIVYGGGGVGLMGAVADGALAANTPTRAATDGKVAGQAQVIGVITEALMNGETGHAGLTRLEIVPTMTARKNRMAALTDAFVALPGGPGTLEEFFEMWTWMTLGIHNKPVAIFDVDGYWQPLLRTIDTMVESGFSTQAVRDSLIVASTVEELLEAIAAWQPPRPKWE